MAKQLQTVDIDGVEILSEGGPYHGSGSPPDGDHFTAEYLATLAAGNAALGELRPPVKIGHGTKQKLLKDSGLADDEAPAAGWVENVRVEERDGISKLIADLKAVPQKLADLMKAKAYRTRSVEIGKVTAQSGDQKGEKLLAITGLALLGAKAPAVRTLDDIAALYADEEIEMVAFATASDDDTDDATTIAFLAPGEMVLDDERALGTLWSPDEGYEALRADVSAALAKSTGADGTNLSEPSYWVRDVSPRAALVCRYENGQDRAWVVSFTRADDGEIELADRADWREAEQTWVEKANEYAESTRRKEGEMKDPTATADTPTMTIKDMSDDQVRALATTLGIAEDVEGDALRDAVATTVKTLVPAEAPAPAAPVAEPGTVTLSEAEHAELRAGVEVATALAEERRVEKRDALIDGAVAAGKLDPAKADEWRGFYDASPDAIALAIESMPVNTDLLRTFGADGDGGDGDVKNEQEESEYRTFAASLGLPSEEA